MKSLLEQKCVPCEGGTPPILEGEAREYLKKIPGWDFADGKLRKQFVFKDFKKAMEFVNRVADVAENEGHHPDISISYNKVLCTLSTHSIGGLSPNDFILAAKISAI